MNRRSFFKMGAVVPGYGMGLVTYVTGDFGGNTFRGVDMEGIGSGQRVDAERLLELL